MSEVLIASSALIPALLILRRIFRKRISRRLQYALWGLVLARLLIPVNLLPAADFSILSAALPAQAQVAERMERQPVYVLPVSVSEGSPASAVFQPDWAAALHIEGRYDVVTPENESSAAMISYAFTLTEVLELTRKAGMGCMALWLAASNLRLWAQLRRRRIPLELPACRYPVYLVEEGMPSPCLFGLFRPAVYLTPAAMESEDGLRHVLAHEEAHGRQLDPLWCLLRGVCLTVYWFDPLVWLAALASREDCEQSCDELALKKLGEAQRVPYGRTLLRLVPVKRAAGGVMLAATTMTSDKKRLKERITRIAENRKMKKAAFCTSLTAAAVICAVTFTGCAKPELPAEGIPGDNPPALSISLTGLTPFKPVRVELKEAPDTVHHQEDGFHGNHHGRHQEERCLLWAGSRTAGGRCTLAWSHEGSVYVSLSYSTSGSFPTDYFLSFPEQEYCEEPFTGLLGYDGLKISYNERLAAGERTVNDYYVFEESPSGVEIYLLARTFGLSEAADMDGDGAPELIASDGQESCQMIFRRDGQLYEADISALVHENWPEADSSVMTFSWSGEEKCLHIQGMLTGGEAAGRQLRFDGKNLRLYNLESLQ